MTIKSYLNSTFEIIVNDNKELIKSLTVIKLCTSHITKNIKVDIGKFYRKQDLFFIASVIGGIFNLQNFKDIDSYIKDFLSLLMSKYKSSRTAKVLNKFHEFAKSSEWPENPEEHSDYHQFEEFETIYKTSKFFQLYNKFIQDVAHEPENSSLTGNKFFSPQFAALFNKKYLAFLPFWSSALSAIRNNSTTRSSNAAIEGKTYFLVKIKIILMYIFYLRLFWMS